MTATAVSQYPRRILPGTASTLPWFCLWLLAVPLSLGAATTFYVDSGWNGMQSGTTLEPWKALSSSAWTAINSALASGDVTVYFSARQAASDADDIYDTNGDGAQDAIDLTPRRDSGSSILTLDGNSMYNTSETAPYWMAYSGTSKCRVRFLTAQNPSHLKHSNITLHGFHVVTTDGNKVYVEAVEGAFGSAIDYAMLVKMYEGDSGQNKSPERRYSPAVCTGSREQVITGSAQKPIVAADPARAVVAEQAIVALRAVQPIGPDAAEEAVIAPEPVERVVSLLQSCQSLIAGVI